MKIGAEATSGEPMIADENCDAQDHLQTRGDRQLTVVPLCTDGFAILKSSNLAEIDRDNTGGDLGDIAMWREMPCQDAMVLDVPDEILERFGLVIDTTLDGYLGRVEPEQLDDVCDALIEIGYSIGN